MKISIHSTIQEIIDQFRAKFPGLKIEFYKHEHKDHEGSNIRDTLPHETQLSSIVPNLEEQTLVLDPEMTVTEFEQLMETNFKLHVQVFRLSRDIWIQTTATDGWTLEKQNGKGQRSVLNYDS